MVTLEHQSQEQHITDYVFPPEEEIDIADNANDLLDTNVTRSGLRRIVTTDIVTQTEYQYSDKPPILSIRDYTLEIRKACVKVLVKCGISTSMAAVAVQAVCEELYHHQYYLTKEEANTVEEGLLHTKTFSHLQGISTITRSCWQCKLRLMLPMLCLQCPAMYDVPGIMTQLLVVRLIENGPVSSSASLTNSGMFYVQLVLRIKTALRLSVCYWRLTND